MKSLSVKLPEALAEWLMGEAKLTRRSRSAIVREALERKRHGAGDGSGAARQPGNMAEALDSLGGTFRGPQDLATNPKYLQGFGERARLSSSMRGRWSRTTAPKRRLTAGCAST